MTLEHLHPMTIHFPIALFIAAFLFELFSIFFKRDFLPYRKVYNSSPLVFSENQAGGAAKIAGKLSPSPAKAIFLHKAGAVNYILAVLTTLPAVLTGLEEAEELNLSHPILAIHRNFAFAVLILGLLGLVLLWFLLKKDSLMNRRIWLFWLLLIVVAVSGAAYNGGRMVYEYGIGVAP